MSSRVASHVPYVYIAPAALITLAGLLYPIIEATKLSFFDWGMGTPWRSMPCLKAVNQKIVRSAARATPLAYPCLLSAAAPLCAWLRGAWRPQLQTELVSIQMLERGLQRPRAEFAINNKTYTPRCSSKLRTNAAGA